MHVILYVAIVFFETLNHGNKFTQLPIQQVGGSRLCLAIARPRSSAVICITPPSTSLHLNTIG